MSHVAAPQGQYAFIILDNSRRIAFAARDPSGSETLFYRIGDDGGRLWGHQGVGALAPWACAAGVPCLHQAGRARLLLCGLLQVPTSHRAACCAACHPAGSASFASSRAAIPDDAAADAGGGEWLELPPGHYISGKTPKLHQFALTPEQLQVGGSPGQRLRQRRGATLVTLVTLACNRPASAPHV
jgi:asparagine synthetase B (glutamine-hydrolysing)